jgi:hypothetical protein
MRSIEQPAPSTALSLARHAHTCWLSECLLTIKVLLELLMDMQSFLGPDNLVHHGGENSPSRNRSSKD